MTTHIDFTKPVQLKKAAQRRPSSGTNWFRHEGDRFPGLLLGVGKTRATWYLKKRIDVVAQQSAYRLRDDAELGLYPPGCEVWVERFHENRVRREFDELHAAGWPRAVSTTAPLDMEKHVIKTYRWGGPNKETGPVDRNKDLYWLHARDDIEQHWNRDEARVVDEVVHRQVSVDGVNWRDANWRELEGWVSGLEDRFRGVSYVDVVDYLIRLMNARPFGGKSQLAIDGTSIGRVVSDMLDAESVQHHAIQMTGGQDWTRKGQYVNAGKTLMIENLAVQFASGDIKFAPDCPLRDEIEADLASFATKTTAAGNQIITQARSTGGHGDLGISLILNAFATQYVSNHAAVVGQFRLKGWW